MARIFFCGIINEVRRRREGTEGRGAAVGRSWGGGGLVHFFEKMKCFRSDFEHI